ncbi:MAG: S8 family serine peptidase [Bacteroidota bacterium]
MYILNYSKSTWVIALLLFVSSAFGQVSVSDSLALVDFYNSTNTVLNNWLTTSPVSSWEGITVEGNRVVSIKLSNKGLSGIVVDELGGLSELDTLDLSKNPQIQDFQNNALPLGLKYLELDSIGVNAATVVDFDGLDSLTYLGLSNNGLNHINAVDNLNNLISLHTIDLSNNNLPQNGNVILNNLPINVEYLDLGYNDIQNIGMNGSPSLKFLNIAGNNLLQVNQNFIDNTPGLEFLDVSHNGGLMNIPSLAALSNLRIFKASSCQIQSAGFVSGLLALEELWLNDNQIISFPDLTSSVLLEYLDVSNNSNISSLPQLNLFPNLRVCKASHCSLTSIDNLSGLSSLEELNLEFNDLDALPDISDLSSLKHLQIRFNNISGAVNLDGLSDLQYVDMSNNNVSTISIGGTWNVPLLTYLSLFNNEIESFPQLEAPNLKTLLASNNKISGDVIFSPMDSLENFSFSHNNIDSFSDLDASVLLESIPLQSNNLLVLPSLPPKSSTLFEILIYENQLVYSDLEQFVEAYNDPIGESFIYAPQDSVGPHQNILAVNRDSVTLHLPRHVGGEATTYEWFKEGVSLGSATLHDSTLTLYDLDVRDEGKYYCRMVNSNVEGLTLITQPITLYVTLIPDELIFNWEGLPQDSIDEVRTTLMSIGGSPLEDCNCSFLELWDFSDVETIDIDTKKTKAVETTGIDTSRVDFNYLDEVFNTSPIFITSLDYQANNNQITGISTLAILDTGIDSARLDSLNSLQDLDVNCDEGTPYGYNPIDPMAEPWDSNGHGTHVTGLAALNTNQVIEVMPIKVVNDNGIGTLFHAMCGIHYAVNNKADVINLSLGYYGNENLIFKEVMEEVLDSGIVVVCSAGNERFDFDIQGDTVKYWPARFDLPNIVVALAIDPNDEVTEFSNVGSVDVDLGAPGLDIKGLGIHPIEEVTMSGTSQAAALTSREVSFLRAKYPNASHLDIIDSLFASLTIIPELAGKTTTSGKLPNIEYILVDTITNVENVIVPVVDVKIYPNPGNGMFYLELDSDYGGLYSIRVFNSLGMPVQLYEQFLGAGGNTFQLNLENQAPGMYLMLLESERHKSIHKILLF